MSKVNSYYLELEQDLTKLSLEEYYEIEDSYYLDKEEDLRELSLLEEYYDSLFNTANGDENEQF